MRVCVTYYVIICMCWSFVIEFFWLTS